MAKIIEFYVPSSYRKKTQWILPENHGKVIPFSVPPTQPDHSMPLQFWPVGHFLLLLRS